MENNCEICGSKIDPKYGVCKVCASRDPSTMDRAKDVNDIIRFAREKIKTAK